MSMESERTPGARCPTHDIALSPSGDCIVCRRSLAPAAQPEPESSWGRALVGVAMVVVMAILALVTWPGADAEIASTIAREPEPVIPPAAAPPPPARTAMPPRSAPREPVESVPRAPTTPRVIQATPPLDRHALAAARRRVSIVMYSTSWCGACRQARAFLDQLEGVSYVDHDIDRDARARERMRALNPRGSIPTIDVEGRVFVGLSPSALERAIDDAARRHM
ncbi:glutaredoxin family protein [Sandaracinus amylolyticus]|uniref:Glutaredoxin NrdH n=1 Tax=Sandaracinus amylolyticus TaxID=927083 RepID=A0A0F6SGZ9_9BACT|nr:glutaredoxin family protein [Sandaracinus amylolyticus]AKF09574.1 Glutaredoxin NrdH [Sandaracinus amylolyticus]